MFCYLLTVIAGNNLGISCVFHYIFLKINFVLSINYTGCQIRPCRKNNKDKKYDWYLCNRLYYHCSPSARVHGLGIMVSLQKARMHYCINALHFYCTVFICNTNKLIWHYILLGVWLSPTQADKFEAGLFQLFIKL